MAFLDFLKKEKTAYLSIILMGFAVYYQQLFHGYTFLDDHVQVFQNPIIQAFTFKNIVAIFSQFTVGMYQPLSSLIYMICWKLGSGEPFAFHLLSLLTHIINAIIVWKIFKKLEFQKLVSLLGALIFLSHPVQVESVSWISAYSNLLSNFFLLLALLYYLKKGSEKRGIILFLFILACLAKSSAVIFPIFLFGLDYWKGKKLGVKSIVEKIPFFIISISFGLIGIFGRESAGHLSDLSVHFSAIDRIFLVGHNYLFYCYKAILPINLSSFYPYPDLVDNQLGIPFLLSPLVLLIFIGLIVKYRHNKKLVLGSILFFFGLLLSSQIIPFGNQIACERYLYFPLLGLCIVLLSLTASIKKNQNLFIGLSIALIVMFAFLSNQRTQVWQSDKAIWQNVLEQFPEVAQAHNNLGSYYVLEKKSDSALYHFDKAVELKSYYADAYSNRGSLLLNLGLTNRALSDLNRAIELRPHADAYFNRANLFANQKNYELALEDYSRSISIEAKADAFTNRAYAYMRIGKTEEAKNDLMRSINQFPKYAQAYFLMGILQQQKRELNTACSYFKQAAKLGHEQAKGIAVQLCQ